MTATVTSETPAPVYTYRAKVIRWIDGDTVDLRVDLGFHLETRERFRLLGVDTPERGDDGYAEARRFCEIQAPVGSYVIVQSLEEDHFGRWLSKLYTPKGDLCEALLDSGHAEVYVPGK